MVGPVLGRNARLYKNGTVVGHGKNISIKSLAEIIKEYDMDALSPAIVAAGKQAFAWVIEKLYIDGAWMTLFLSGEEFDMVFQPAGSYKTVPYEEWTGCVVLGCERRAGEIGGLLEIVIGETKAAVVYDTT